MSKNFGNLINLVTFKTRLNGDVNFRAPRFKLIPAYDERGLAHWHQAVKKQVDQCSVCGSTRDTF